MKIPLQMTPSRIRADALVLIVVLLCALGPHLARAQQPAASQPIVVRPFAPVASDSWAAFGVGYGPFRQGQRPGGPWPTKEQIREDLHIIAKHWQMLRTYGSDEFSRQVCEVIREDKLPLKLMVGAWVATEQGNDTQRGQNETQVQGAIEIANEFPEVVAAVSVGNETQVFWSFHKVASERLIDYVRQVRAATKVPVTVADDFLFWTDDASLAVAAELDFIVTHIYAMWHSQQLDNAIPFTQEKWAAVKKKHPEKLVILGEAGWCTDKPSSGDQANRLRGEAGEPQQAEFFKQFREWVLRERVPVFYFSAFDEPWKGSEDPHDAEKHWGVFHEDRSPKAALKLHPADK